VEREESVVEKTGEFLEESEGPEDYLYFRYWTSPPW
jgi:hypothetical protein